MLSKFKKTISCFLLGEEGQISKKSLVGLGIALSAVGVQTACAQHTSSTNIVPAMQGQSTCRLTGKHQSSVAGGGGCCIGGCCCCFVAGTSILMDGYNYKHIEEIRVGEFVLAYDYLNKELKPAKVSQTFVHDGKFEYLIINNMVKLTSNHPVRANGKWMEAGMVKIGDKLFDKNFKNVVVRKIDVVDEPVKKVFNLEVDKWHNYFAEDVLVHNKTAY